MDDVRDSFSRLKKGIKHRLTGKKRKGDQPGAGAAADEDGSDWKATVSASAKLLLRGVRDSADAFGPLKSVAGGLCFILENCEVRYISLTTPIRNTHMHPSEQRRTRRR